MEQKNNRFLSKKNLYGIIDKKITDCGFNLYSSSYRVDSVALAGKVCVNPRISIVDFEERKICGILYKTGRITEICLNAKRSPEGRNFDCMHELLHYWLHSNNTFYCSDTATDYYEWQANEGAAQFLMPYQNFIPKYHKLYDSFFSKHKPDMAYESLKERLADEYGVGRVSVEFRIKSLQDEISQFLSGRPMEEIEVAARGNRQYKESEQKTEELRCPNL